MSSHFSWNAHHPISWSNSEIRLLTKQSCQTCPIQLCLWRTDQQCKSDSRLAREAAAVLSNFSWTLSGNSWQTLCRSCNCGCFFSKAISLCTKSSSFLAENGQRSRWDMILSDKARDGRRKSRTRLKKICKSLVKMTVSWQLRRLARVWKINSGAQYLQSR